MNSRDLAKRLMGYAEALSELSLGLMAVAGELLPDPEQERAATRAARTSALDDAVEGAVNAIPAKADDSE